MKLHFLGTASGVPCKERNVSATALDLMAERGEVWLFDCGEATQHQLLRSPIRPGKIAKIFITHLHGDHIFGLPGLLSSRSMLGSTDVLELYGPAGLREFTETALRLSDSRLGYPLHIRELADAGEAFADDTFRVRYRTLRHRLPSYGYRISEAPRPGSLNTAKLAADGIPAGALYARLKNGESVTLPDGRTVHGTDYLDAPQRGREIVHFGDTAFAPDHASFCRNADVLVHEATFGSSEAGHAERFGHATAAQAAETARQAQVKQLYLTHLSARYTSTAAEQLLAEARTVFPHTSLAHDLAVFDIPKPD